MARNTFVQLAPSRGNRYQQVKLEPCKTVYHADAQIAFGCCKNIYTYIYSLARAYSDTPDDHNLNEVSLQIAGSAIAYGRAMPQIEFIGM